MTSDIQKDFSCAFHGIDINTDIQKDINTRNNEKTIKLIPKNILTPCIKDDAEGLKSNLLHKIQSYGKNKRFSKRLRQAKHNFTTSYLSKRSIEDLKLELENIDNTLADGQNNSMIDHSFKYGLSFVENIIAHKTIFQVKGTTAKLFEDEYFMDLLERAKMKYGISGIKMDPLLELTILISQTALVMHQTNKLLKNDNDALADKNIIDILEEDC